MITLLCCVISFLTAVQCKIVKIPNGKLQGSYNGKYYSFTNIRYGTAPRFEAPRPYTDTWIGVHNSTSPSIPCVQFDRKMDPSNGVEDCLTLNIFTPDIVPEILYPVRAHIIGGAFLTGDINDTNEELVVGQDIVLVLFSYRIGPFGFLSDGTDSVSGNFGLKDQKLALKWIHENIHAFGGDPSKVLLSGVSAGGASVHCHLLNPGSWDYFNAAMSSSGCALNPWAIELNPKIHFNKYIGIIGCNLPKRDEVKKCLQNRTKEDHFAATNAMREFDHNPVTVFRIVREAENVENAFLTDYPVNLIQRGLISHVPWVISKNVREGSVAAAEFLKYDENGTELIEVLNSRWREIAPVMLFYNNNCVDCDDAMAKKYRDERSDYLLNEYMEGKSFSAETYPLLERIFTSVAITSGFTQAVLTHGMYSKGPVYAYVYDVPLEFGAGNLVSMRPDIDFGADHGADMRYVLPSKMYPLNDKPLNKTKTANEIFIGSNLINMGRELTLSGIAKYGDHKLPINNATHVGMLKISENYYEIESYSPEYMGYTKSIYNNKFYSSSSSSSSSNSIDFITQHFIISLLSISQSWHWLLRSAT